MSICFCSHLLSGQRTCTLMHAVLVYASAVHTSLHEFVDRQLQLSRYTWFHHYYTFTPCIINVLVSSLYLASKYCIMLTQRYQLFMRGTYLRQLTLFIAMLSGVLSLLWADTPSATQVTRFGQVLQQHEAFRIHGSYSYALVPPPYDCQQTAAHLVSLTLHDCQVHRYTCLSMMCCINHMSRFQLVFCKNTCQLSKISLLLLISRGSCHTRSYFLQIQAIQRRLSLFGAELGTQTR